MLVTALINQIWVPEVEFPEIQLVAKYSLRLQRAGTLLKSISLKPPCCEKPVEDHITPVDAL